MGYAEENLEMVTKREEFNIDDRVDHLFTGYKNGIINTVMPKNTPKGLITIYEVIWQGGHKDWYYGNNLCLHKEDVSHGGPSSYYDFPFKDWITTNDMMEYLAEHKWGKYGIHLKDIFKGICRWGDKKGTTQEYDARKIIYYGCRVLMMIVGVDGLRKYLNEILNDEQFGG